MAVQAELMYLRPLYRHLPPNLFDGTSPTTFNREAMLNMRSRTRTFRPKYRCPLCKRRMRGPPVMCRNFSELGQKIRKLAGERPKEREGKEGEEESVHAAFPCNFDDYFLFFDHRG